MSMSARQKRVRVSGETSDLTDFDKPQKEFIVLDRRKIMGTIGIAFCFATIFINMYAFIRLEPVSGVYSLLSFLVGIVVGCAIIRALAGTVQTHRIVFFLIAVFVYVLYVATLFIALPSMIPYITSCCFGLSIAAIYLFYGEYLSKYLSDKIGGTFAIAFLIATLLLIVVMVFKVTVLAVILPAVSFVLYGVELIFFGFNSVEAPSISESKSRNCVVGQSYVCTANSSLMLGFCASTIICCGIWEMMIAAAIVVCATCVLLYADGMKKGLLSESFFMVSYLPICSVILVLQLLVVGDWRFALIIVLMCFTLIPTLSSASAICKHISFCNLSGIHVFSLGRLVSFAGILLGFAMGFASQITTGTFLSVSPYVFCICVLLLISIFVSQFAMKKNYYPEANPLNTLHTLESIEDDMSAQSALHATNALDAQDDDGFADDNTPNHGMFRERCDYVASVYGLSARQSEIMSMLAKGRNGSYITKTLVISSHTAKAHIYNIYQKLGVHSRQELMDLVDNVELPQETETRTAGRRRR